MGFNTSGNTKKTIAGGLGSAGSLWSGYMDYSASKASSSVMNSNADMLDEKAISTLNESAQNLQRARRNQYSAAGEAATYRASRNVTAEGSGLAAELTTMQRAEIEINDAATRARQENQIYTHKAALTRWEASQQRKAGKWAMLGGVLSGATKIAGTVAGMKF